MNTLDDVDDVNDDAAEIEKLQEQQHEDQAPPSLGTEPATVKAPEAAKILDMHEGNVRKLAVEGKLPGVKKGRSWVFKLQDVFALKRDREKALDPR